ncbi:phosphoglycolate phosphatase-like HAD superfamily hydrolase [Fontibacillus solani]|uniref:Phosphoglycolate phosphatase-like HAD superfamily hydrolase n=1 Tax=Fontibacillus solani TaxID=1572857 RepID=A0A7W3SX11_9BACL|nr:phosphoglycolate phosphatase-like HAD superfamily hydrolase [Fontibacillus solani]
MRTTLDRFYSHVLFDLDGTLTDPKLGITKSVQYELMESSPKYYVESVEELYALFI